MILGVSHLALRVADIDRDALLFTERGWQPAFRDDKVLVSQAERPLLRPDHPEQQSLLMLRHPQGWPAIELIGGGDAAESLIPPAGWLLLPGPPPSGARALAGHGIEAAIGAEFPGGDEICTGGSIPGILSRHDGAASFHLLLSVPCLSSAAPFWSQLGFCKDENTSSSGRSTWTLRRPLRSWSLEATLIKAESEDSDAPLERPGCCLLSLLSTDLPADLGRLAPLASKVSTPFCVAVNGQKWTMALLVAPGGLVIELMAAKSEPNE